MMRTRKLYEQPKLIALTFEEDVITSSSDVDGDYDKGKNDIFDVGLNEVGVFE